MYPKKHSPFLTKFAQKMRGKGTASEELFWEKCSKAKVRMYRQVIIGNYIVDFFHEETRTIVEIDGGYHKDNKEYDLKREEFLRDKGYKIVRVKNEVVSIMLQEDIRRMLRLLPKPGERYGKQMKSFNKVLFDAEWDAYYKRHPEKKKLKNYFVWTISDEKELYKY